MKITRSKFESSELQIISNVRNTLLLMWEDPQCPPKFADHLMIQSDLLAKITIAHGIRQVNNSKMVDNGVLHEWPKTFNGRIRAIR